MISGGLREKKSGISKSFMSRGKSKIYLHMKKIILSLIAIVLISFSTSASNSIEKFSAQVTINSTETFNNQEINSNVLVGFKSIESFNEFNYNDLNTDASRCSVSVTVSVGIVSVTLTAECDCSEVKATIKKLKAIALEALASR
jgi:hypothetical protein